LTRFGLVEGDRILDLAAAAPAFPVEMDHLLPGRSAALAAARHASDTTAARIPLQDVRLEAPLARPPKFLAIGLNYAAHAAETGRPAPEFPIFFNKQSTCVAGPFDPIHMPRVSHKLDYEGELGLVIATRCRHVARTRAHEVVAGYLVVNDVSVRDWQAKSPTMTLGKSFDTHGPIGPWITTPDEVGDPHRLELRTWVNGELRQHANTADMIFDCYAQIEILSTVCTLEPGDIISTGTPSGVGVASSPRRYLEIGDVVRVEIEKLGHIENRVIAEPDDVGLGRG